MASHHTWSQPNISIGTPLSEVIKSYPDAKVSTYEKVTTLTWEHKIYDLSVQWNYRFENEKLARFGFAKYYQDNEVKKENFDKCKTVADRLIKDMTELYGIQPEITKGDSTFVDPYVKHHYGYEVIKAQWLRADKMNIGARFKFQGSKGIYFLLLELNYVDENSKLDF